MAAKSTTDVIEGYKSDVEQLRRQMRKLTDTVNGIATDRSSDLSDTLRANLQTLAAQGEETLLEVRDRVEKATADTQDAIAKNPLTAVSLALGAGVVIGMLCRNR